MGCYPLSPPPCPDSSHLRCVSPSRRDFSFNVERSRRDCVVLCLLSRGALSPDCSVFAPLLEVLVLVVLRSLRTTGGAVPRCGVRAARRSCCAWSRGDAWSVRRGSSLVLGAVVVLFACQSAALPCAFSPLGACPSLRCPWPALPAKTISLPVRRALVADDIGRVPVRRFPSPFLLPSSSPLVLIAAGLSGAGISDVPSPTAWLVARGWAVVCSAASSCTFRSRPGGNHMECSHDHPCVLPGTSAPRSTSSRSATLTVLPFGFTSHQ